MRGHKRDNSETMARNYLDPRSFTALFSGCEILYGKDKEQRRREIWDRAKGRCEAEHHAPSCKGFAGWNEGQWHHTYAHDGKKCDCLGAAVWTTARCHSWQHRNRNPRLRWILDKQAAAEFDRVNPPDAT
jgi:hypothetical protein